MKEKKWLWIAGSGILFLLLIVLFVIEIKNPQGGAVLLQSLFD